MTDFSSQLSRYSERENPCEVPGAEDWARLENAVGFVFPQAFKDFYFQVARYYFEGELPSLYGKATDGTDWLELITRERQLAEVKMPGWLVPFCAVGNGDFHCFRRIDQSGEAFDIVYWYGDQGLAQLDSPEVLASDFSSWLDGYVEDRF